MTEIIEFIIWISLIAVICSLCVKVYKRIYLIRVMKRISTLEGVSVKMLKNPLLTLFRFSWEAEYTVNVLGENYVIRTYNGDGGGNAVHFATE